MDEIIRLYRDVDSFAAIESIAGGPDALAAAGRFAEASSHFYWKEKDLPASVALGRAGVQFALAAARAGADEAAAAGLRGRAKAMAYNVASFTWPGWDEPGIWVGPSDLAAGLDAARFNLRLGTELGKGPLPLSRAHWMLGGHWLAASQFDRAREQYRSAAGQASLAGAAADHLLAEGSETLTDLIAQGDGPDASVIHRRLDDIRERLRPLENGEMFLGQLATALRVFRRPGAGTATLG